MRFHRHVGIDYSGAGTPESPQSGLQVYMAQHGNEPGKIRLKLNRTGRWDRAMVADFVAELGRQPQPVIVGIDHAFSFPTSYMDRYGLSDWDAFLEDFCHHWPTGDEGVTVDSLRKANRRTGAPDEFRLTDNWTSSAKSVFRFDVPGQVAKSTHAGIPWLAFIRQELGDRVHFWPFDGWDVPEGKSMIAEVYPSIFRHRFPVEDRNADEQDAYVTARWLLESDERGILDRYLHPSLTADERHRAGVEGWILGIC